MSAEPARRRPRVLVNAAGSTSGGGETYVKAMLAELLRGADRGVEWEWLVQPAVAERFDGRQASHLEIVPARSRSAVARTAWEQLRLPLEARSRADVLVSAANFAPLLRRRRSVLLARNAVHFEPVAAAGSRGRRYRVESALARSSAKRSRATVTATQTMADLVTARTGVRCVIAPFGPGLATRARPADDGRVWFLHRTKWGAHKRLTELLLAVRRLADTHPGRFRLVTACDPTTPFAREFAESARQRELLADPAISAHVEVGEFPATLDQEVQGDAVVMPSTLESFCFPLAEAVGLGLPIVAADSAFARELCGASARLADPADHGAFAAAMAEVIEGGGRPPTPQERARLSWTGHADRLAAICRSVAERDRAPDESELPPIGGGA